MKERDRGMSARKWEKKRHKKSILAKVTHSFGQNVDVTIVVVRTAIAIANDNIFNR